MLHYQQRQPGQRLASCDRQVGVFCATASDKAFENIDCMIAILRCQAENCFIAAP